jgi:hypothetical protein
MCKPHQEAAIRHIFAGYKKVNGELAKIEPIIVEFVIDDSEFLRRTGTNG